MDDLILDACCLINLAAAGNGRKIIEALKSNVRVCSIVVSEAVYLRLPDPENADQLIATPIDVRQLLDQLGIEVCEIAGDEESRLFVHLAASLDDGEAMSLSIASHRHWRFATDDRKALTIAGTLNVAVMTTPEVVKHWADMSSAKAKTIATTIHNIETSARFIPRRGAKLASWWKKSGAAE